MAEQYRKGDRVTVREDFPIGHFRTPVFIRGKTGVVTHMHGTFNNPELLAYALKGPRKALYKVRFKQTDIWPDYTGSPYDTLDVDIYEHWLEKA